MGQQMMIIALLGSTLLTGLILTFSSSWNTSNDTVAMQYENEQALNVSGSGVGLAISQLRQNKRWRAGFYNYQVTQRGYCTLAITDVGTDTVRITSTGAVNHARHTSVVLVKLSSIFPSVEAALQIFGDSVKFSNDGKAFAIDGRDYKADGTLSGGRGVSGIAVQDKDIQSTLQSQLIANSIADNVLGKEGTTSVGISTSVDSTLTNLKNQYRDLASIRLPSGSYSGNAVYGTLEAPQIVYVPGDLDWSGVISGAGILVVDGKLKMSGKIKWEGIVISVSGDVELQLGGSGTPSIIGTTLVGNDNEQNITNVHVNGNPSIKYSGEILENVLAKLGLLSVEIISYYE